MQRGFRIFARPRPPALSARHAPSEAFTRIAVMRRAPQAVGPGAQSRHAGLKGVLVVPGNVRWSGLLKQRFQRHQRRVGCTRIGRGVTTVEIRELGAGGQAK
jgi:hypothetical protein